MQLSDNMWKSAYVKRDKVSGAMLNTAYKKYYENKL